MVVQFLSLPRSGDNTIEMMQKIGLIDMSIRWLSIMQIVFQIMLFDCFFFPLYKKHMLVDVMNSVTPNLTSMKFKLFGQVLMITNNQNNHK